MPSVFPTIQGANLNEDESSGDCDYVCWNSLGSASHNATANPTRPDADANCALGPDANHTRRTNHRAGTDTRSGSRKAPAAPQQKKEIKDPAEYNAYVGAIQQTDPAAQISGLEAFLAQYPNSVMKEDALETLMVDYQKTNNQAKMLDAAQRILQANPNNLRALALLALHEASPG